MNKHEKIRVLFLITDLGKGGAQRYLIDLCRELEKSDEFEFIIGSLSGLNLYDELTDGLPIINLKYATYSFYRRREFPEYKKLLEDFKPHIIHTHRFLAEFLSSFHVNRDIFYICHGHDNMEQFRRLKFKDFFNSKRLINYFEKVLIVQKKYKKVKTIFIANSKDTQEYYQKVLPKRMKNDVFFAPLGFNFSLFYDPCDKILTPNQKVKIINVGSFQPKKNQLLIVDIASELKRRRIDFEINLLGDGELWQEVKKKVELNGMEKEIFLHGVVNNVEDWYKQSHIYLHTAWYEPFGLVFLEAMAAGLPVVTLDGKGNRDIFYGNRNGFIFKNPDPNLFADAIVKLSKDQTLFRQFSKNGKEYASYYDTSIANQKVINFYLSFFPKA